MEKVTDEAERYGYYKARWRQHLGQDNEEGYKKKYLRHKRLAKKFAKKLEDLGFAVDLKKILKDAAKKSMKEQDHRAEVRGKVRDTFGP